MDPHMTKSEKKNGERERERERERDRSSRGGEDGDARGGRFVVGSRLSQSRGSSLHN